MITNLEDLLHTIESVKTTVKAKQPGSTAVFRFAMEGLGRFLDRLSADLSNCTSTTDVYNTIEKFHEQTSSRLSVLDGVRNKAELSGVMKDTHAQIKQGLMELQRARSDEFYAIIDAHVNVIGERFNNYHNPSHKDVMCKIGDAMTNDLAMQWNAVERIASMLETISAKRAARRSASSS